AALFGALFPPTGQFACIVVMAVLGPVVVLFVERAAIAVRGLRHPLSQPALPLATLIAGAAFLFVWVDTSWTYAHLDDGLVLVAPAFAVWGVARQRAAITGMMVGLAIAAKLTGVLLVPLLACFPWRRAVGAAAVAFTLAAAAWLPFVVADAGAIAALRADVM